MCSKTPLLSICVPTYNRAAFLSECLASIFHQVGEDGALISAVEIIISDNGSTDTTPEVVESYRTRLPVVRAIRHPENLGLDRNVNGCIRAAIGDYIWIFSDDDVMSYGTIRSLVDVLRAQTKLGMVYLDSYGFRGPHTPLKIDSSKFQIKNFATSEAYLKNVNYWITFLSGNVFRRDAEISDFKIEDFEGGLFGFLAFYCGVLINRGDHARLDGPMVARREDNVVGGYKLYKTFTVDLNHVLRAAIKRGLTSKGVDAVNIRILASFLPSFTFKMKRIKTSGGRLTLGPVWPVLTCNWKYPELWLITLPSRILPLSIGQLYCRLSAGILAAIRGSF